MLRGDPSRRRALSRFEKEGGRSYCCAISYAEIFAGIRPGEEAETEAFFAARGEVVIDASTGRRAGGYLLRYRSSHALGVADALIAASATTAGLRLWTGNRRDYPMPDLKFFDA